MESTDINAAFGALFGPLRSGIRRGLSVHGQFYALEMDACIPGELLGSRWLEPAGFGALLGTAPADATTRRALLRGLCAAGLPEPLFVWLHETHDGAGHAWMQVEVASADGLHGADWRIGHGRGAYARELHRAPHRRLAD